MLPYGALLQMIQQLRYQKGGNKKKKKITGGIIYFVFKSLYFMGIVWLLQKSKHENDPKLPILVNRGNFWGKKTKTSFLAELESQ